MTDEQIKIFLLGRPDDEFVYSDESTKKFDELMDSFKK